MTRKPSDISTEGQLIGTLGKMECEEQAVSLLKILVENGDEWRAVTVREINEHFFPGRRPGERLFTNPKTHFTHLLEYGYGEQVGEPDSRGRRSLQFTERAMERMRLSVWNTADPVPMTPQERWCKLQHI